MTETCDVLIVGGGPGGSSCARRLQQAGLDVLVIDKSVFPRDKTCAGWVTPQVLQTLQFDSADYAVQNVFQPITAFQTGLLGESGLHVDFSEPVSYGIRRCEFDRYLLDRSQARCRLGEPVNSFERTGNTWLVNNQIEARMLVGAGGHFCPIARRLRSQNQFSAPLVTAVEAEFVCPADESASQARGCCPQLYFCSDLSGYGWCVRKGEYLNIGIGLVDSRDTTARLPSLLEQLNREGTLTAEVPSRFHGHAYHLYDGAQQPVIDDGVLLVGDAAGLAYPESGEGIRPAVESGLMAAETILAAHGQYDRARLEVYQRHVRQRYGRRHHRSGGRALSFLPNAWREQLTASVLRNRWFARNLILDRWFLHRHQPVLRL